MRQTTDARQNKTHFRSRVSPYICSIYAFLHKRAKRQLYTYFRLQTRHMKTSHGTNQFSDPTRSSCEVMLVYLSVQNQNIKKLSLLKTVYVNISYGVFISKLICFSRGCFKVKTFKRCLFYLEVFKSALTKAVCEVGILSKQFSIPNTELFFVTAAYSKAIMYSTQAILYFNFGTILCCVLFLPVLF